MTFASVKCDAEKIQGVKVESPGIVMYTTMSGLMRLAGDPGMPVAADYMLRSLLLAVDKNLIVEAEYPEGYDCKTNNETVAAKSIYVREK